MTALVLGAAGQVGRYLKRSLPAAAFWTRADADLEHPAAAGDAVRAAAPAVIVHCAAFTAVDRAESEPLTAWRVNAEGTAAVAAAAAALDVPLLYVSTDYVFDGASAAPYRPSDPVSPINVYGRSKLAGELAVRSLCPKHWIIRTSWVFGAAGGNFVRTMLRLGGERDALRVVSDQRGRPTYAGDIAALIAGVLEPTGTPLPWGTYHTGGGPDTTWHAFATTILDRARARGLIDRAPRIEAVPTADYPTPARRPANSVLEPSPELEPIAAMDWSLGLDETLNALQAAAGR